MAEALMGAINHSADLSEDASSRQALHNYTKALRKALHNTFRYGQGTKDLSGPTGLSTEEFVTKVGERLTRYLQYLENDQPIPDREILPPRLGPQAAVDGVAVKGMFDNYDVNGDGSIDYPEFLQMVTKLGVAPLKSMDAAKEDKRDEVQQ